MKFWYHISSPLSERSLWLNFVENEFVEDALSETLLRKYIIDVFNLGYTYNIFFNSIKFDIIDVSVIIQITQSKY